MFSVKLYRRGRHACHVEGMSQREASRHFGIHRNTVRKMLTFSVLPGYWRGKLPPRPSVKDGAVMRITAVEHFVACDPSLDTKVEGAHFPLYNL
jgi:hypothetical protein